MSHGALGVRPTVGGSTPPRPTTLLPGTQTCCLCRSGQRLHGCVVQRIEQRFLKPCVASSNLAAASKAVTTDSHRYWVPKYTGLQATGIGREGASHDRPGGAKPPTATKPTKFHWRNARSLKPGGAGFDPLGGRASHGGKWNAQPVRRFTLGCEGSKPSRGA